MIDILLQRYRRSHTRCRYQHSSQRLTVVEGVDFAQSPIAAIVSCCDARLEPSSLFELYPGEVFSIRNIANLVPIYSKLSYPCETAAGLEFAVSILQVPHIVVLGHSDCIGIQTMLDLPSSCTNDSYVDRWVRQAKPADDKCTKKSTDRYGSEPKSKLSEQASICLSLNRMLGYPWIRSRVKSGQLTLHGWYYDFCEDELFRLEPESQCFIRDARIANAKSA